MILQSSVVKGFDQGTNMDIGFWLGLWLWALGLGVRVEGSIGVWGFRGQSFGCSGFRWCCAWASAVGLRRRHLKFVGQDSLGSVAIAEGAST